MMKKHLLIIMMMFVSAIAGAEEVVADGIIYNLYSIDDSNYAEVVHFDYKGYIDIPSTVSHNGVDYKVNYIGENAFYKCSQLLGVILPQTIDSIGPNAFLECTGIKSVALPDRLKSIGENCFSGCNGIVEVTIPNSVESIGRNAFDCCI